MPNPIPCADAATLQQFLLGQLPEEAIDDVEQHLAGCASCSALAQTLQARDTLVDAVRRGSKKLQERDGQAVADFIERMCRLEVNTDANAETTAGTQVKGEALKEEGDEAALFAYLAPPQMADELGRLGPFRILKILGKGGMGIVFLAEDTQLNRQVAVKTLLPSRYISPTTRQRFLREARAAAALQHDHIVPIYQVGEDRDLPFIAMPLLQGESLAQRLRRETTLPPSEIIRLGRQIATGLAAAHQRGLIHRDITLRNIWLENLGPETPPRAKILDFGLARSDDDDQPLTEDGAVMGTPGYLAPEQCRGEKVDARCDLFSLGSVLYRMSTGRAPFSGNNLLALLRALDKETPASPSELNPAVPRRLSDLVMKLLEKDRDRRYASAAVVVKEFESMESTPMTAVSPADTATYVAQSSGRPVRRRRPFAVVAAAALLLAFAGALYYQFVIVRDRDGNEVARLKVPEGGKAEIIAGEAQNRPVSADDLPPWRLPVGAPEPAIFPFGAAEARTHQEHWAKFLKRDVFQENSIGMKLAVIPPGEFEMTFPDSEQPPRLDTPRRVVRVRRPFAMATTEVTCKQFKEFVDATSYKTDAERNPADYAAISGSPRDTAYHWRSPGPFTPKPDHPVLAISYHDACAFCAWLGKKEGLTYRLPTEAEWVFACRAGSRSLHGVCADTDKLPEHAHFAITFTAGNSPVLPVGQLKPNAFGLFDMLGNAWEWCADGTHSSQIANVMSVDPGVLPLTPSLHGGGWDRSHPTELHPEFRFLPHAGASFCNAGFRVVAEIPGWEKPPWSPPPPVQPGEPISPEALVSRPPPIAGLRSWSVELVPHACEHADAALHPHEPVLATGAQDSAIRFWNLDGRLQQVLLGHADRVMAVDFSPDGKLLGSLSRDSTVRLWDWKNGTCVHSFVWTRDATPPGNGGQILFSPDGSRLAVAGDGFILAVLELKTGRVLYAHAWAFKIAWSSDSERLLVAGEFGKLGLWQAADLRHVAEIPVPEGGSSVWNNIYCPIFAPDGKSFVTAGIADGVIRIWDARTRTVRQVIKDGQPNVYSLAWNKDGNRLASVGLRGVEVWDLAKANMICSSKHGGSNRLVWSADAIVTVSPVSVQLLDPSTANLKLELPICWHWGIDWGVSPDGTQIVSSDYSGTMNFWDAASGKFVRRWELGPISHSRDSWLSSPPTLFWSPQGDWIAVLSQVDRDNLALIDVATGKNRRELKPPPQQILAVAWTTDGKMLAAGGRDKIVRLWDVATGALVRELPGHESSVCGLAFSPDGTKLVSTSNGPSNLRLWNVGDGKLIASHAKFTREFAQGLNWSADGQVLLATLTVETVIIDPVSGQITKHLPRIRTGDWRSAAQTNDSLRALLHSGGCDTLLVHADNAIQRVLPIHGVSSTWLPDRQRFLVNNAHAYAFDAQANHKLGVHCPWLPDGQYACIGPDGHYRGSRKVDDHLVYVAVHEDGSQRTYKPAEFRQKFGWKNDPEKVRLLAPDPAPEPKGLPLHAGLEVKPAGGAAVTPSLEGQLVSPGEQTLGPSTLVTQPAPLPGVKAWTVETLRPRDGTYHIAWGAADLIATSNADRIRIWDRDLNLRRVLLGRSSVIHALAWSPDGRMLAAGAGHDQTVSFWDAVEGKLLRLVTLPHYGAIISLAWSPDGRVLAVGREYGLMLIDVQDGTRRDEPRMPWSRGVAWSPDGKQLLAARDNKLEILDAETFKVIAELPYAEGKPWSVAWSSDARLLAASDNALLTVWDARTRQRLWQRKRMYVQYNDFLHHIAFSPDGKRLASCGSSQRLWDAGSGELLAATPFEQRSPDFFSWSPDGKELVVLRHNEPCILDGRDAFLLRKPKSQTRGIAVGPIAAVLGDGGRIMTATDKGVKVWESATGRFLKNLPCESLGRWAGPSPSPRGDTIAVSDRQSERPITLFDTATGFGRELPYPRNDMLRCFAWSPDGKWLAAGDTEAAVTLWAVATGKVERVLDCKKAPVRSLAWSHDGKRLAAACLGIVRVWDTKSWKEVQRFEKSFARECNGFAFHPDNNRIAALTTEGAIAILDCGTGQITDSVLPAVPTDIRTTNLAWSPDGQQLLAGREALQSWNSTDGQKKTWPSGNFNTGVNGVHWLKDGHRVIYTSEFAWPIFALDTKDGRRLGTLIPELPDSQYACIGPTGHWSGSSRAADHLVYVVLTEDGRQETYSPANFAKKYGWRNAPEKASLLGGGSPK